MEIPISEAKARLSELAEIASTGEEVVLTVHGEPKARLTALAPKDDGSSWAEIMKEGHEYAKTLKPEDMRKTNPIIEERRRRNYWLREKR